MITEEIEKKLIVANILNNVPIQDICKVYHKSEKEIEDCFYFVMARIKSYWFEMRTDKKKLVPWMPCDNYADARNNRMLLFKFLDKVDLSVLKYKVRTEKFDEKTLRGQHT